MNLLTQIKHKTQKGEEVIMDIGAKASNVLPENFVEQKERSNLTYKDKLPVIFGKLSKWYADLRPVAWSGSYSDLTNKPTIPEGAAANYQVANNDTTEAEGFVADARIVRTHGLEIDGLSRDLGGLSFGQDADGNWGYKAGGADTVTPFKGDPDFDYEHGISIPYVVAAGNPNVLHYYTMTAEDAAYSYLALFAVTAGSVVSIELSGVSGPSIVCNKPGGSYSFALIANPVLNGKVNFRHGGTGDGHVYKLMIK